MLGGDKRLCRKCERPLEEDRPKQARYCKGCSVKRSGDWKREHPEIVKLYDSDERANKWRARHDWAQYIKDWREKHYQRYREQNRRHVHSFREWQRKQGTARPPTADPVGDRLSHKTGSSSGKVRIALLVLISLIVVLLAGFALGRGGLPSPRDISFEAVRTAIVDLSILSVEVTGLLVILILCWKHISDLWGRK